MYFRAVYYVSNYKSHSEQTAKQPLEQHSDYRYPTADRHMRQSVFKRFEIKKSAPADFEPAIRSYDDHKGKSAADYKAIRNITHYYIRQGSQFEVNEIN